MSLVPSSHSCFVEIDTRTPVDVLKSIELSNSLEFMMYIKCVSFSYTHKWYFITIILLTQINDYTLLLNH